MNYSDPLSLDLLRLAVGGAGPEFKFQATRSGWIYPV